MVAELIIDLQSKQNVSDQMRDQCDALTSLAEIGDLERGNRSIEQFIRLYRLNITDLLLVFNLEKTSGEPLSNDRVRIFSTKDVETIRSILALAPVTLILGNGNKATLSCIQTESVYSHPDERFYVRISEDDAE